MMKPIVSLAIVNHSIAMIAGLFLTGVEAHAAPTRHVPQVGDTYEISLTRDSLQHSSDGSSESSSHDQDMIVERVIAVRTDGLELEYDLPKSATADERAAEWQFPARVLKPIEGSFQLLNRAELEARVDPWLKAANWTRAVCGHWIFTWNGFRIDCDPQSVIRIVEAFDLRSANVHEGALYQEDGGLRPGTIARKSTGANGTVFTVEMAINPDTVQRARAETDVAVGEMTNKPVTLDAALRERSKDAVSGTISVTFETNAAGDLRRRTKVTKLETKKANGTSETESITETLERQPISGQ